MYHTYNIGRIQTLAPCSPWRALPTTISTAILDLISCTSFMELIYCIIHCVYMYNLFIPTCVERRRTEGDQEPYA